MQLTYAAGVTLLGGDVSLNGQDATATMALRVDRPVAGGLSARVELLARDSVWASASQPLPGAGWGVGEIQRLTFELPLAAGTPAGAYAVRFDLLEPDGSAVEHGQPLLSYFAPVIGPVKLGMVTLPARAGGSPQGDKPAVSNFGPLQLLSWQAPQHVAQGDFVPVDLWWQPSAPLGEDLTASVKVIDAQGMVWAQHDGQPREGYNPTSAWQPGQLERDVQMVLLPGGILPGDYDVAVGWYNAATGLAIGPQGVRIGRIHIVQANRADVSRLGIPYPLDHPFPNGLEILGFDLPSSAVKAGQPVTLRLFWRVNRAPGAAYQLAISFRGQHTTVSVPEVADWQQGELVETRLQAPTTAAWAGSGQPSVALTSSGQETPAVTLPQTLVVQP